MRFDYDFFCKFLVNGRKPRATCRPHSTQQRQDHSCGCEKHLGSDVYERTSQGLIIFQRRHLKGHYFNWLCIGMTRPPEGLSKDISAQTLDKEVGAKQDGLQNNKNEPRETGKALLRASALSFGKLLGTPLPEARKIMSNPLLTYCKKEKL